MKKIILLGMTVFLLFSCQKEDGMEGTVRDVMIDVVVRDKAGNDLLAPEAGFVGPDSVWLCYEEDGVRKRYFDQWMEMKRGWRLTGPYEELEGCRAFSFSPKGYYLKGKPTTTYIEWNDRDVDTVEAEIHQWNTSSCQVIKVWWNGKLVWECEPFKREGPRLVYLVK